jgi:hypothetical protein
MDSGDQTRQHWEDRIQRLSALGSKIAHDRQALGEYLQQVRALIQELELSAGQEGASLPKPGRWTLGTQIAFLRLALARAEELQPPSVLEAEYRRVGVDPHEAMRMVTAAQAVRRKQEGQSVTPMLIYIHSDLTYSVLRDLPDNAGTARYVEALLASPPGDTLGAAGA